jgi:hypothetical protein
MERSAPHGEKMEHMVGAEIHRSVMARPRKALNPAAFGSQKA